MLTVSKSSARNKFPMFRYVFVHILSQENLSLTEGQLFEVIDNPNTIANYFPLHEKNSTHWQNITTHLKPILMYFHPPAKCFPSSTKLNEDLLIMITNSEAPPLVMSFRGNFV